MLVNPNAHYIDAHKSLSKLDCLRLITLACLTNNMVRLDK